MRARPPRLRSFSKKVTVRRRAEVNRIRQSAMPPTQSRSDNEGGCIAGVEKRFLQSKAFVRINRIHRCRSTIFERVRQEETVLGVLLLLWARLSCGDRRSAGDHRSGNGDEGEVSSTEALLGHRLNPGNRKHRKNRRDVRPGTRVPPWHAPRCQSQRAVKSGLRVVSGLELSTRSATPHSGRQRVRIYICRQRQRPDTIHRTVDQRGFSGIRTPDDCTR